MVHWPRHALVLASELGSGYEVHLLDVTAEFLERRTASDGPGTSLSNLLATVVEEAIARIQPDLIALHAHAAPHLPVVAVTLAAIEKVRQPSTRLVIGGMAASQLPGDVSGLVPSSARPKTLIVRGEATGRIVEIVELALDSKKPANGLGSLEVRPSGLRELLIGSNPLEMDYAQPRFDLLNKSLYQRLFASGQFVPHLEMTSGCTFGCTFCGVHYPGVSRRLRRRLVSAVVAELRHLREEFGFDDFYFCDETFTLDMRLAADFCHAVLAELPGIRWRCVTRVDRIDEGLAELMAKAGCWEIGFGTESAGNQILSDLDKRASVEENQLAIGLVQRHGIAANALTIIGLPHEDHSDIRRTFEFLARDARPQRAQIFVFHPVPGTEFYKHPERHGLHIDIRTLEDWYLFDHIGPPVSDTALLSREDIVRYFLLFNQALSTALDPTPDPDLIRRVLDNRFPVRRKGIVWLRTGPKLQIYRPAEPDGGVAGNTHVVEAASETGPDAAGVIDVVLSQCTGLATPAEIARALQGSQGLSLEAAQALTADALAFLKAGGYIAEF